MSDPTDKGESAPCGSWRVIAYVQGYEETVRWCERRSGPCPFPATERSTTLGAGIGCAADLAASGSKGANDA